MGKKEPKKPLPSYEEAKTDWQAKLMGQANALRAKQEAEAAYDKACSDARKAYEVIQAILRHEETLPEYYED